MPKKSTIFTVELRSFIARIEAEFEGEDTQAFAGEIDGSVGVWQRFRRKAEIFSDGLHLNRQGYETMSRLSLPAMRPRPPRSVI